MFSPLTTGHTGLRWKYLQIWHRFNEMSFRPIGRPRLLTLDIRSVRSSVTILGDLLDFGQLFKPFGINKFVQNFHILRQFL